MALPHHDDSLVFADDTRLAVKDIGEKFLPKDLDFLPNSQRLFEPTQIDQSTSPVFRSASFSSDERDISLPVIVQRSPSTFPEQNDALGEETGATTLHDLENEEGMVLGADTQIIGEKRDQTEIFGANDDTQVILPKRIEQLEKLEHNSGKFSFDSTPTAHASNTDNETSKDIEIALQLQETTASELRLDFFGADTQVIGTNSAQNSTLPILPPTDDTQVISSGKNSDTLVIGANQDNTANHTNIDTQNLTILDKPTLAWKDTQPITQFPELQTDLGAETLSQVQSSPNKNFELDTTLLLLPSKQIDEPTTQVLNTQEEMIENDHESIDLGHKPVLSSGQNEAKLRSDLSIISNDDDMRDQDNEMVFEDSVFQHRKRRRIGTDSEEEEEYRDPGKESGTLEGASNANGVSGGDENLNSQNISISDSPAPLSSNIRHKVAWSQSLSDLEDVSHDVKDLDINVQEDDTNDVILVPKTRRRNEIPATQSQSSILREDQETLEISNISYDLAVWAFSQFRHYPARILEYGEGTLLVEFFDLAQIEVKNTDLFFLDVRIGDNVRLHSKTEQFVVTGLGVVDPESEWKCTRGYDTVFVTKWSKSKLKDPMELQVRIFDIYMDIGEWAAHQQKYHILHQDLDLVQENYGVVRGILGEREVAEQTAVQNPSLSPKKDRLHSTLFSGYVFFVTSIEESRKSKILEMITTNGGVFIDDDIKRFTELTAGPNGLLLALKKFESFRFGALLADNYSRSAKYLQALALGWPILADCFIEQVLKTPTMLDDWPVYLLPAGQSLVTKSLRSLDVYQFMKNCNENFSLDRQFDLNQELLFGWNIVVLNTKQDARTLDMCGFIFHAFGAKSLKLCSDTEEVRSVVLEFKQKVLVYDNLGKEYEKLVRPKKNTQSSNLALGIIDWEWVVQCVISGYIWPPKKMH